MSYLGNLTLRLSAGATRLPRQDRRLHGAFLAAGQNDDGGFSGRRGPSDLYYTGFALRGLALLGELTDEVAGRAATFLQRQLHDRLPSIDFLSLVYSAVLLEVVRGVDVFAAAGRDRRAVLTETMERFRRRDGGFAKTDRSTHGSTYHTFLTVSCMELVDAPIDGARQIVELIRSRRRDDGGFVELDRLTRSGTNPTAAAEALLRLLDAMDETTQSGAAEFLAGMQNVEGGLRANTQIPVADLLSTFTGLVALGELDGLSPPDLAAVKRYVRALEQPNGGFRGGAWDDAADVEYTFYGLGTLALLHPL